MGKPTLANTGVSQAEFIGLWKATEGSEPSQYLQEEKTIVIPSVAASERGLAQTLCLHSGVGGPVGPQGRRVKNQQYSRTIWNDRPETVKAR